MFPVPGWSVSADKLKRDVGLAHDGSNGTKKGKRTSSGMAMANVADLWEQVIEGKKKKPRRVEPVRNGEHASGNGPNRHELSVGEDGVKPPRGPEEAPNREGRARDKAG